MEMTGGIAFTTMQLSEEDKDLYNISHTYSNSGYVMVRVSESVGEAVAGPQYVHRIVARRALQILLPPRHLFVVDHINEDKLDNRRENLRLLSPSDNVSRKVPKQANKLGFSRIAKIGGLYEVLFKVNSQTNHFGAHNTPEEAAFWADVWVYRIRGAGAKFNFPERIEEIRQEAATLNNQYWEQKDANIHL